MLEFLLPCPCIIQMLFEGVVMCDGYAYVETTCTNARTVVIAQMATYMVIFQL
jgi:hypothetical protein